MAMFAAATWKGGHGNFVYNGDPERNITLWLDTESPENDFHYFQKDVVLKMMELGIEADALWALNFTHLKDIADKREAIYELFTALSHGGTIMLDANTEFDLSRVGLVVFDGIVDIIDNTIDESDAKVKIEEYKYYVQESGVAHVTVLHSDKKGMDLRGTFGTFLGQKASGTTMVKSDAPGAPARVAPHKGVRGTRPYKPYHIMWDEVTGLPYVKEWEERTEVYSRQKEHKYVKKDDFLTQKEQPAAVNGHSPYNL
jgi:hypothetical protein